MSASSKRKCKCYACKKPQNNNALCSDCQALVTKDSTQPKKRQDPDRQARVQRYALMAQSEQPLR